LAERLQVVVHQERDRIVAGGKALAFGAVRAVCDLRAELALLVLEFEFFHACGAEEIGDRAVVRKAGHLRVSAVRAASPSGHPGLCPRSGFL
jgi:hypothetical protein